MSVIGAVRARHVAADAIIGRLPFQPYIQRQSATLIGVAFQASFAEIGDPNLARGQYVRIMAGDTPEAAPTGAEATALVHLLGLAREFIASRGRYGHEHRPESIKLETRPKVLASRINAGDPSRADQVALLANCIAK
jgi:hypothetical protein